MFVIFDDRIEINHAFKIKLISFVMPQKKNNSNNSEKPQNAYFLSLELENVRCFGERQKIDFSAENGIPRRWTIILGDNGTGKTTILQNLIAMLPKLDIHGSIQVSVPNISRSFFEKNKFKTGSKSKYRVGARYSLQPNLQSLGKVLSLSAEIDKKKGSLAKVLWNGISINCFAYGASRKAGNASISEQKEESEYKTLFDETALLISPEEWLLQADYASKRDSEFKKKREYELELVKRILIGVSPNVKGALPDVDNIRFSETESGRTPKPIVEFQTPYGWVESKDLSLGYRTSMAWIVDFASRMFDLYPESDTPLAEPAVVLIDEIDLHLHPKWQRELIDYLTNLFPHTQFIVTTHSPLIVQAAAAQDANIVVCRREGDHVVIDQSVEAVRGWRADQILTSDLFDLPSTRDTELEKLEKQRREILSKAKLTKADEKKVKELSAELDNLRVMENPEDDKAMDIIRRAAAHLQNGES